MTEFEKIKNSQKRKDIMAKKKEERALRVERKMKEAKCLVQDVAIFGLTIEHPKDFSKVIQQNNEISNIFINHLNKNYSEDLLKSIAESLAYSNINVITELLDSFIKQKYMDVRIEIAQSIQELFRNKKNCSKENVMKIKEILNNEKKYGYSITPLFEVLSKIEKEKSIPMFVSFLDSKEQLVYTTAIGMLGNFRVIEVENKIESFLNHTDSWVRGEVKKALKKIETAKNKLFKKG